MITLINSVMGIIAGLIAIFTTYYLIVKYFYGPEFIIGVLPDSNDIGKESKIDEFYFYEELLAKKIFSEKDLKKLKNEDSRIRTYKNKKLTLPIIVQNIGEREADKYKVSISFSDSSIRIKDVHVESMLFDTIYSQDEVFENEKLNKISSSKKIHEYYKKFGLTGSYLSLTGSIASKSFDMIIIEIEAKKYKDFFINFRVDSPNVFSQRALFSQLIRMKE